MRAPWRLATFVALLFKFTCAFQGAHVVNRIPKAKSDSTSRAPAVVSEVAENTASEQRVWLDSADAKDAIDIYEVTSKSFDMVRSN